MLPKTVRVMGIPYTVVKQDRITVNDQNADGAVTYNSALIEVVNGMPIEVERVVVMHEVIHAMFKGQGQNDYRHDEDLIEAVAHGVIQVIRDNPQLLSYLLLDRESKIDERVIYNGTTSE